MASDNHAHFARVGFTVLAGVAAIVGTLIYLGGFGDRGDLVMGETYSETPMSGLSVGSEVNFRGVKVGQVRAISFVGAAYPEAEEKDRQTILVRIAFDARQLAFEGEDEAEDALRSLVAKGLRATVTSSGVTGLSKIEMNFPDDPAPLAPISWRPEDPCIPPQPSMLTSFTSSASEVMRRLGKIDFAAAWSNVTTIAESVASLTQNADTLVESQRARVDAILQNLEETTGSLKELVSELKDDPSLLLRAVERPPLPETAK